MPKNPALEARRRASRRKGRRLVGLAEVAEEPGDALRIFDERDDLGAAAAVLAGLEVDGERTPEQLDEGAVLRAMRRRRQRRQSPPAEDGGALARIYLGGIDATPKSNDEDVCRQLSLLATSVCVD